MGLFKKLMTKFAVVVGLVLMMLSFQNCSGSLEAPSKDDRVTEERGSDEAPTLSRTVFMSGLDRPWDMAFLDDGTMFFTEKCRGLSVRETSGNVRFLFGINGAATVAGDIFCQGQSGVAGVAVDPEFETNGYVYIFTASNLVTNPRTNRILRLTISSDLTSVTARQDIVEDIAFKDVANAVGSPGAHSGGRLRFGPDGSLYITTGDNHNGPLPQDLSQMGGKVLRVDRAGNEVQGNNTPSGGDPRIFTYGHRNVQGISFHPETGQAFTAEHGPGHSDEVTPLVAGGNAGWDPTPNGGVTCPSGYCGYTTNKPSGVPTPMTDFLKYPDALPPLWSNDGNSDGMGPCEFLSGDQWKAWNGRLAVGIMGARRLDLVEVNSDNTLGEVITLNLPSERVRSVVQGPNGNLFVMTDGGEIWEISPN